MTNKQTIDGVSRELLESFAAYVADSPNAIMRARAKELRFILDSQHAVCSNGILCQNSKCAECGGNGAYKPAAWERDMDYRPEELGSPETEPAAQLQDTFNGDNKKLAGCIKALLSMDAAGALVPHGIGGHARQLLEASAVRIAAQQQGEPVAWIKPDVAKTLTKDECCYAFGSQNPKGTLIPLYAEQPAPVAVVLPEQTVRRAFICKGCEGVYADEDVSKCDCMCEPDFVEGEISYAEIKP